MVSPTTLQLVTVPNPLGPWNSPDVKVAQQYGYLKPIYPKAVADGYVRFYLTPLWQNDNKGDGKGEASMRFYDLSNAQIASNKATADLAAAIASSNAVIAASNAITSAAVAWTNEMINLWLQSYHTNAAHMLKVLGTKYYPGFPTNKTPTFNSAIEALRVLPEKEAGMAQLRDIVYMQRYYNQLTDFLSVYCPSTNTNDPTDYDLKRFPFLWDLPGVK